jgi:histidinol-phosphate/aromatic aminotransferase/cobyric acid decarboxylase-like protein
MEDIKDCLMLGNGASELIDLVTRVGAHPGNVCIPNSVQYKEYERAALADGRTKIDDPTRTGFSILAIVNPCNPTGEYRRVDEMKAFIEKTCNPSTTVLVDESMQPWVGTNWRDDSLVRQREWVKKMYNERDIRVFVIHSWTKIWSCPGIRLGSVLAPTAGDVVELRKNQVPWSVNICALAFLTAAVGDTEYLQHTWSITTQWRQRTVDKLREMHPTWEVNGESFLSWLWVDTKDAKAADEAVRRAKIAGVPIRAGKHGYEQPTFIRIAVRSPEKQDILFEALNF